MILKWWYYPNIVTVNMTELFNIESNIFNFPIDEERFY